MMQEGLLLCSHSNSRILPVETRLSITDIEIVVKVGKYLFLQCDEAVMSCVVAAVVLHIR